MLLCTFELNDEPLSAFKVASLAFPAFSGQGEHANKRSKACIRSFGPIPTGSYYILDRESGGRLGALRDFFSGRSDWFALYASDGQIDDETLCDEVKRGNFRLHPKGSIGRSEGCIVIDKPSDFLQLRTILKSLKPMDIPGSKLKAYGTLIVK